MWWKKAADFQQGYAFYLAEGNYPMEAFMLHQRVELTYRGVELLIIGKEKMSHSIRIHQKLMHNYMTELSLIFHEENEQEQALLALLDAAYRSVRYELDYQIDKDQLLLISNKADLIQQIVAELYQTIVAEFTKELESQQLTADQVDRSGAAFTEDEQLNLMVTKKACRITIAFSMRYWLKEKRYTRKRLVLYCRLLIKWRAKRQNSKPPAKGLEKRKLYSMQRATWTTRTVVP